MSSPKQGKLGIANLLSSGNGNSTRIVPPVLIDVGKLAAGVASVNTSTTSSKSTIGSATGNPRNKCALPPGHSLMDWIRLGASGKDLTGVGDKAGRLSVTPQELAKHNKLADAWLAIRGTVYNVTAYLPFHPGGPEELMRGVGKDATSLFDEIHPWVNYQSILQKCCVGRLVSLTPSQAEKLFDDTSGIRDQSAPSTTASNENLPKFDWSQKSNEVIVVFQTPSFANPSIEIMKNKENVCLNFKYSDRTFTNEINFSEETLWPPGSVCMNYETGRFECVFEKTSAELWKTFGVLQQTGCEPWYSVPTSVEFTIVEKVQLTHNIFFIKLRCKDNIVSMVPLCSHVRIYGDNISRCYTPIPNLIDANVKKFTSCEICLMVKRYDEGNVSRLICDSSEGDGLHVSKPLCGDFRLENLEKYSTFLMLAAGTGITPMISLIFFLLERREKKCHWLRLIFCNKTHEDIPFNKEFQEIASKDKRFKCEHVLSQPGADWHGKTGYITSEIVEGNLEFFDSSHSKNDLYVLVCGNVGFNRTCMNVLNELQIDKEKIHVFQE